MKQNMGVADKVIRTLIALTLIILFLNKTLTGTIGWVAIAVSAVFLITSFFGFCPLYRLFGLKTKTRK